MMTLLLDLEIFNIQMTYDVVFDPHRS